MPAKYVLYSHYGAFEQEDLNAFKAGKIDPEGFKGIRFLVEHLNGLKELLNTPGHAGLLVLFYAAGYHDFLDGLASGTSIEQLWSESVPFRFAQSFRTCISQKLKEKQLENRVRIITPFELHDIFGRVNAIVADQLRYFFVGNAEGVRYDAPKVVEAILRLRLLGNGLPVLRIDHDVLFTEANRNIRDLGLFKAITCAVRAYQLRIAETSVSTFVFSASYDHGSLFSGSNTRNGFETWSQAFATRIYPALVVDQKQIGNLQINQNETEQAWNYYAEEHFDEKFTRQFYGFRKYGSQYVTNWKTGLASIGAHPLYSVISGALLCLSEGAILDLPPFSNFRMNVSWIDDHLKYSLHRAMDHFTSGETLDLEYGLSDARMDTVMVSKERPRIPNLPRYVCEGYLPTLLWGTIVDAWITTDPILKFRFAELKTSEEKEYWRRAKEHQGEAPLPRALRRALEIGSFDPTQRAVFTLRTELKAVAATRIERVRQLWSAIEIQNGKSTFASNWAQGKIGQVIGEGSFEGCSDLWRGLAPNRSLNDPIRRIEDLPGVITARVLELIDDTIEYIRWTLQWPKFVQIVRSVRQGSFAGDLSWQAPTTDEAAPIALDSR